MQASADRTLTLSTLVEDLRRDGLLNDEDHSLAQSIRRGPDDTKLHPITMIARQGYKDARTQGKVLSEQVLVEWLAGRENMECYAIDPLEINVTAVTDVMSYAFSERHQKIGRASCRERV